MDSNTSQPSGYAPDQHPPLPNPGHGYQPGVGAPVNQQYLQPHQTGMGLTGPPQQPQHDPSVTPGGYDAPPPQQSQYPSTSGPGGYGPPPQQQQHAPSTASGGYDAPLQQQQHAPSTASGGYDAPPKPPHYVASASDEHGAPPPPQYTPGAPDIGDYHPQQYPPPPSSSTTDQQLHGLNTEKPLLPSRSPSKDYVDDDISSPVHYTRDPHKLVAYLVPFPKPQIKGIDRATIPDRFLIYTPPPPPLSAPAEGEKEGKVHKVQRKWQDEVRAAKTSTAKTASWKGVKSKATRGINAFMAMTTTSNLDFVNRISGDQTDEKDKHSEDGMHEEDSTHKTVGLDEMILIYPTSFHASPEQAKTEFVNTMMRTKSKAQRDAIISTGLLPVAGAIDLLATIVWPFGGLLEADGVWAYSSIRGAKTARSVTKRLTSSTSSGVTHHESEEQEMKGDKLRLNFFQSPRLEVLYHYLTAKCSARDYEMFQRTGPAPTESEVLASIGWAPSQTGNANKNWEDEQWETEEVKDDIRSTLSKAAKEWDKWCKMFAKDPQKALKK